VNAESKWLEYFAKLGVYSKVNVLCEPEEEIMDIDNFNDSFIQEEDSAGECLQYEQVPVI
jgi:hypothetical protein